MKILQTGRQHAKTLERKHIQTDRKNLHVSYKETKQKQKHKSKHINTTNGTECIIQQQERHNALVIQHHPF